MKCPNCGKEVEEGSKFCSACGAKLEASSSYRDDIKDNNQNSTHTIINNSSASDILTPENFRSAPNYKSNLLKMRKRLVLYLIFLMTNTLIKRLSLNKWLILRRDSRKGPIWKKNHLR